MGKWEKDLGQAAWPSELSSPTLVPRHYFRKRWTEGETGQGGEPGCGVTVVVQRGQLFGSILSCCDWLTGTGGPSISGAICHSPWSAGRWMLPSRQQLRCECERGCGCVREHIQRPLYLALPPTHTHIVANLCTWSAYLHVCVCLYMCLSAVKQQVCHHQRHWIAPSSIMSRRADLRWPVGKDTHALSIYIHERPSFHSRQGLSLC